MKDDHKICIQFRKIRIFRELFFSDWNKIFFMRFFFGIQGYSSQWRLNISDSKQFINKNLLVQANTVNNSELVCTNINFTEELGLVDDYKENQTTRKLLLWCYFIGFSLSQDWRERKKNFPCFIQECNTAKVR